MEYNLAAASHQSLRLLIAHPVKLHFPSPCVCVCVCTYGWRWGCWVSDDTGGVIPPTSASNLQHEKDTRVTPYLPPTVLSPPSPLLLPNVTLSHFCPNQTVAQITKDLHRNSQSNTRARGVFTGLRLRASEGWRLRRFVTHEKHEQQKVQANFKTTKKKSSL